MNSNRSFGQNRIICIGPWQVDLEQGQVSKEGSPSGLNPRAEDVLLFLCRHAGMTVSHEEILNHVWASRVVEDASVSKAVWLIRKGLGEQGKDILQTRPKRGYVLAIPSRQCAEVESAAAQPSDQHDVIAPDAEFTPLITRSEISRRTLSKGGAFVLVAAMLTLVSLGFLVFRQESRPVAFTLPEDAEMTVSVVVPHNMKWLRTVVLRSAVEQAYLRGGRVMWFQGKQGRNPFAGPHLQVEVSARKEMGVVAEISLEYRKMRWRREYRGHADGLRAELTAILKQAMLPGRHVFSTASDAYVSGVVAELVNDNLGAVSAYRRAVAANPGMIEANVGLARTLSDLGFGKESLQALNSAETASSMTDAQRCDLDVLLATLAPDRLKSPKCARARSTLALADIDLREALRIIDGTATESVGAERWLRETNIAIEAHIRLEEWPQAEARIARTAAIAREAGWEYAAVAIENARALAAIYRGEIDKAVKIRLRSAQAMQDLGHAQTALWFRIDAMRNWPLVPGSPTVQRRQMLRESIEIARRLGDRQSEADALQFLSRIDRDDPLRWQAYWARIMEIADADFAPEAKTLQRQKMLQDMIGMRRYGEVIAGVKELQAEGESSTQERSWNMTLLAEAHMARGAPEDAISVIDAMESEKFPLSDTGDACQFAWLFAEVGLQLRARNMLAECRTEKFDRSGQAMRGDYGLLAEARLLINEGEQAKAWRLLKQRIDALLSTSRPIRQEAESLTLLARYATALDEAEEVWLERALARTHDVAKLDGAGPGLRFGVHMLRWRLCIRSNAFTCGPALPAWAAEDGWEVRLAEETVVRPRLSSN